MHYINGDYMYYTNTFFLFSIIGHFIENFFYVSKDSGIFFGYWTPIYGIGVCVVIYLYNLINTKLKLNSFIKFIIVFLIGFIILSSMELLSGILIEKFLRISFWDYSNEPFSIFRYTSLKMSFIWGISSLLTIYIIKPILDKFITKILRPISYILITLFTIDIFLTFTPYLTK